MSDSLRPHPLQHARLPFPPLSPGVCSHSCPLSWWCCLTISSPTTPALAFSLSQEWAVFQRVGSLHHVAKVLELQLQYQSFQWIFRLDFLYKLIVTIHYWRFPGGFRGKETVCQCKRHRRGFHPWAWMIPWRGAWHPLHTCLENPMGRGDRLITVHRVTKSRTQLKWLSMHMQSHTTIHY